MRRRVRRAGSPRSGPARSTSFGASRSEQSKGKKMRRLLLVLSLLCCSVTSAVAQVSVGIGLPGVNIGINLPVYPELVPVPGYPVYYAPRMGSNYFFYDGMYWVYQRDNWYASSWYNGPWGLVQPEVVPLFVLRVPVRYYRQPPAYFRGWVADAPPRWGDHWGNSWSQSHSGMGQLESRLGTSGSALPVYQRQYSGSRYPRPSSRTRCKARITVTSRRTPSCSSTIRPRCSECRAHPHRPRRGSQPPFRRLRGRRLRLPSSAAAAASVPREQRAPKAQAQDKGAEFRRLLGRRARPPSIRRTAAAAAAPREQRPPRNKARTRVRKAKGLRKHPSSSRTRAGRKTRSTRNNACPPLAARAPAPGRFRGDAVYIAANLLLSRRSDE